MSAVEGARRAVLPVVRRAARPDRAAQGSGRAADPRLHRGARRPGTGPRRPERLRQPAHRQGPHHRARDFGGLQRRDHQGAEPRGAPVHQDSGRPRGRQRAPDEGGGEVSRAVARARSAAARARRRARAGEGPRAAVHAVRAAAVGAAADVDPGRVRRRERRQPLDRRTHGSMAQSHGAANPRTPRNRTPRNPVEPRGTPWNPRRSDR